ncbi:MAG: hypothetical protein ABIC95_02635 [archaeon]
MNRTLSLKSWTDETVPGKDIYDIEEVFDMLQNDELAAHEEAFMRGYIEDGDPGTDLA